MYTWGGGFKLICSKNPVPCLCVRVCVCMCACMWCVCVIIMTSCGHCCFYIPASN